jgi:hypothetical protein
MFRIVPVLGLCALLAACAAQPRQASTLPTAPPTGESAGVAGLGPEQIKVAFGAPAFVRKDGQTEMWRYDSPRCRAFFFFYGQQGVEVVRHVETLPRGATMAADVICLDAMRVSPPVPAKVS